MAERDFIEDVGCCSQFNQTDFFSILISFFLLHSLLTLSPHRIVPALSTLHLGIILAIYWGSFLFILIRGRRR